MDLTLEKLIGFEGGFEIADIGAAAIAEVPPYKVLLDRGLGRLNAFDADERQHEQIRAAYGDSTRLFTQVVGDGKPGTLYLAYPESGMSSLLKPSVPHLEFFNGFPAFGKVYETLAVKTFRLDDIDGLPPIDFLKMDIQGAELLALEGGTRTLGSCVAIQLEVSFAPLYEGQPSFGAIDVWMRKNGFLPHKFESLKRWSVSPIIRDSNFRRPWNQLLEADIVYIRDPVDEDRLDDSALKKLAIISHYVFRSPDLTGRLLLMLSERGAVPAETLDQYFAIWQAETGEAAEISFQ